MMKGSTMIMILLAYVSRRRRSCGSYGKSTEVEVMCYKTKVSSHVYEGKEDERLVSFFSRKCCLGPFTLVIKARKKKKYVCLQLIFVPPLFCKMHQCNNSTVNDTNSGFPFFAEEVCLFAFFSATTRRRRHTTVLVGTLPRRKKTTMIAGESHTSMYTYYYTASLSQKNRWLTICPMIVSGKQTKTLMVSPSKPIFLSRHPHFSAPVKQISESKSHTLVYL